MAVADPARFGPMTPEIASRIANKLLAWGMPRAEVYDRLMRPFGLTFHPIADVAMTPPCGKE